MTPTTEAIVVGGSQVVVRAGSAMIQLQVLTSVTTAAEGGVEIARLAVDAIS